MALRLLPAPQPGAEIGKPAASLLNDTSQPVVVMRCRRTCALPDQPAQLGAGRSLRIKPGSATEWVIEDSAGTRLGCLTATAGGNEAVTLYVSRAGGCRT